MDEPTELVVADDVAERAEGADDVEEELLVEEISIDGMCGVY
jgi:mycofactocin precursor